MIQHKETYTASALCVKDNIRSMEKKTKVNIPAVDNTSIPGTIIYRVITGKHLTGKYKRNDPVETRGVYVANKIDVYAGDVENIIQLNDHTIFYEVAHFMNMIKEGQPIAFDMLFAATASYSLSCSATFRGEVLDSKLLYLTQALGHSILDMCTKWVGESVMSEESIDRLSVKMEDSSSDDIRDYISFRPFNQQTYDSFKPMQTWRDYERSLNVGIATMRQHAVVKTKIPNIYDLYFDVTGKNFCNGIVIDNNIVDITRESISRFTKARGIIHFDKEAYDKRVANRIKSGWDSMFPTETEGKWIKDTYDESIFYRAYELMECMRYLDTIIEFFENGIYRVTRKEAIGSYDQLGKGALPFDEILMIMMEKMGRLEILMESSKVGLKSNTTYLKSKVLSIREKCYARTNLRQKAVMGAQR